MMKSLFDGKKFFNPWPGPGRGPGSAWKMMTERRQGAWKDWPAQSPEPKILKRVKKGECRVCLINHATVLIQLDGFNVLTDPTWSERCSPFSWAGPRRHQPPGLAFGHLPPLDVVLVSHNHYDHMDLPTLKRLNEAFHPPFVMPLGNAVHLKPLGPVQAKELDWWQCFEPKKGLKIWAVPAQHFSSRGLFDHDRALWAGFVIETRAGAVYFAGDTALAGHFQEIHKKFPKLRLAMLPMGAYLPRWFMGPVHMDPDELVKAVRTLKARHNLGLHWGTFALGSDEREQPLQDLKAALKKAGMKQDSVWVTRNGGTFRVD